MKKLELSLDALAIESFDTGAAPPPDAGTIEAREADCTAAASCKCPSSLFRCGTLPATAYSCPRTFDC